MDKLKFKEEAVRISATTTSTSLLSGGKRKLDLGTPKGSFWREADIAETFIAQCRWC
jgi:hypothetical protein